VDAPLLTPPTEILVSTFGESGNFTIGTAVPEPSTWAMMLIGFAGLGYASYRRSKKNAAALVAA
jgi:PEP-CTERM motif